MLSQTSLVWKKVKNNRRTIGLLSLIDNWHGVNLWRNENKLSTLVCQLLPTIANSGGLAEGARGAMAPQRTFSKGRQSLRGAPKTL